MAYFGGIFFANMGGGVGQNCFQISVRAARLQNEIGPEKRAIQYEKGMKNATKDPNKKTRNISK